MGNTINVIKANGDRVAFDGHRLKRSLARAGASPQDIADITAAIEGILYDGISTKAIYQEAFELLRQKSSAVAGRYKLKKAMLEFGPSGYPFERYIGELLKYQGYAVNVGEIVKGHCVHHEVDVVAKNDATRIVVECKFHSDQGRKCDVKVPLYIHSRFNDIHREWKRKQGRAKEFHQGWVVTNTRFSDDAVQYGNCAGLWLVGWDFPAGASLREQIDTSGLHPITCLSSLTKGDKQALLNMSVVLCRDLREHPEILKQAGVNPQRHKAILREVDGLLNDKQHGTDQ